MAQKKTAGLLREDAKKMKGYICERLPEDGRRVILADGPEGGPVWAHLFPVWDREHGWDLQIETNEPEWVCLKEVYSYVRRTYLTSWEGRDSLSRGSEQGTEKTRVLHAELTVVGPTETATGSAEQPPYQFQCLGDYWLARFTTERGTTEGHFRDLEGVRHIAKLLAQPEKAIEAIDLQGLRDSPVANQTMKPQFASDARGRQAFEKRMADLEQEIAQADPAEKMVLQEEYEHLSAIAQDSKERRLGPPSPRERARKAVRNAIDRAKGRIRTTMPELARFLDRSIQAKGTAFVYSPAPPAPRWVL